MKIQSFVLFLSTLAFATETQADVSFSDIKDYVKERSKVLLVKMRKSNHVEEENSTTELSESSETLNLNVSQEFVPDYLVSSGTFKKLNLKEQKIVRGNVIEGLYQAFQERDKTTGSLTKAFSYYAKHLPSKQYSEDSPLGITLEEDENGNNRDVLWGLVGRIGRVSKEYHRRKDNGQDSEDSEDSDSGRSRRKPIPKFYKSSSQGVTVETLTHPLLSSSSQVETIQKDEQILTPSTSGEPELKEQDEPTYGFFQSSDGFGIGEQDDPTYGLLQSSGEFRIGEQNEPAPGFFSKVTSQVKTVTEVVCSRIVKAASYLFAL